MVRYQGYREENNLPDEQLALIPDYLHFRFMQSYAHNYIVFDFDNLLDWQEYVHKYFRRIIMNNEAFLKVDWA